MIRLLLALLLTATACAPREGAPRGAYVGGAGGVTLPERAR